MLGLLDEEADFADQLARTGRFAVSLLGRPHRQLADVFAGQAPAPGGVFTVGRWRDDRLGSGARRTPSAGSGRDRDHAPSRDHAGWALLVRGDVEHTELAEPDARGVLCSFRGRYAALGAEPGGAPASLRAMTTVLLIRHGRTSAEHRRDPGRPVLGRGARRRRPHAGGRRRRPGWPACRCGRSSPPRCAAAARPPRPWSARARTAARSTVEQGLIECGYGDWTGKSLKELAEEKLWATVQAQPSAVRFPGGESMTEMSARAVGTIRRWDARMEAEHGADAVWAAVSHGDVIKAILADALGMHLDASSGSSSTRPRSRSSATPPAGPTSSPSTPPTPTWASC